ncbi:MAG: hypothetical protein OXN81_10975 [Alphaproteobacteria bacterium]|nr:hypothetical protein [Alphaproteobacteria bacterium]
MMPGLFRRRGLALLPLLAAVIAFGDASAQTGPLTREEAPVFGAPSSPAPGASRQQEEPASSGSDNVIQPLPAAEERAAPPDAGLPERQAGGAGTAAAGPPGRQLPPPPAAPAFPSEAPEWFWRTAEIAQAFECPIGPLAAMLEAAHGESEFSPALELEREVLVLCRDRWEVLKGLMDAELTLAAVLRSDRSIREREAIALEEERQLARARVDEARQAARARVEGARQGAREGARQAAKEAEARKLAKAEQAEAAAAPKVEPAVAASPEPDPGPAPEERYGWFAMKGSGTELSAGVTDGEGRWWVRVGDDLPGGVRIGSIRARPPRVVVAGGAAAGLPYRPGAR